MAELLIEFEGQQKEATDACATYQQEKAKRLVLEKRCADMELVNDSLRQENLVSVVPNAFSHAPPCFGQCTVCIFSNYMLVCMVCCTC